jgi:copper chaperone CopZ
MQRVNLVIPQLHTASQALDLSNSLMSISGISHVQVDESSHTLTAEYDEEYLSEESLKEFVKGAGYPSAGDETPQ